MGFVVTGTYRDEENYFTWVVPAAAVASPHRTAIGLFATTPDDPRLGHGTSGMVFTAANIETTYRELKAKGVTFTLDLIRHPYGEGEGDQEARFIDPDGNEFLLHT